MVWREVNPKPFRREPESHDEREEQERPKVCTEADWRSAMSSSLNSLGALEEVDRNLDRFHSRSVSFVSLLTRTQLC